MKQMEENETQPSFLERLRSANVQRQAEWKGSNKVDMLFRATELGEEAGEVLGAIKKIYRAKNDITGNHQTIDKYMINLREEIGDLLIVLDLLAIEVSKQMGGHISLEDCAREKFNATSIKHGMDTRLDPPAPSADLPPGWLGTKTLEGYNG